MKTRWYVHSVFLFLLFFLSTPVFAGNKSYLIYQGRILKSDGSAVNAASVTMIVQIVAPSGCLLWEQSVGPVDFSSSKGTFSVTVGNGANTAAGGLTWEQVFQNGVALGGGALSGCGGTYTGAATDDRTLYAIFNDGSGNQTVGPVAIKSTTNNSMLAGFPFNGVPTNGQTIAFDDTNDYWYAYTPVGGGSLNSVALSAPAIFSLAGSPVTGAGGTITMSLANQTANTIFAGPSSGGPAAPTFRSLVAADIAGAGGMTNPMTTLGDTIYGAAAGSATRLAGNATTTKQFLTQTGDGVNSAAPGWGSIGLSDITSGLVLNSLLQVNATGTAIGNKACGNGELLYWNSLTGWTCSGTLDQYQVMLGGGNGAGGGAPTVVSGVGASGQVLTSSGAGVAPTWQNVPSSADNLGNHTATTNIQLNGNWLSNDGGSEGIRIDNSGNVGIGTASPTSTLSVLTPAASSDGNGILLKGQSSTVANAQLVLENDIGVRGQWFVNPSGAWHANRFMLYHTGGVDMFSDYNETLGYGGDFRFYTSPASGWSDVPDIVFDQNGKVGIGTTTPTANLHVNGYQQWDGGSAEVRLFPSGDSSYIGTANAYKFSIRTGAADRMTFDTAGNVGIGMTSPTAKLHMDTGAGGATVNAFRISPSQAGAGDLTFTMTSNNRPSIYLRANNSGNGSNIEFRNNASLRTATISDGFEGNHNYSVKDNLQIGIDSDNDGTGVLDIVKGNGYNGRVGIDGTTLLRVLNNGNVGIGTSSPNTILDINGAFSVRGMAEPALSPAGQGRVYFDSTSNTFKVSENGGAYTNLVSSAADNLGNHTATTNIQLNGNWLSNDGGSEGIRVDNSGNVGIGTTSPGQKLTVGGGTNDQILLDANGTGGGFRLQSFGVDVGSINAPVGLFNLSTFSGKDFAIQTSASERLRITNTGNVGIGTTAPAAAFQVGDVAATNTRISGNAATAQMYWQAIERVGFAIDSNNAWGLGAATGGYGGLRLGAFPNFSYLVGAGTSLLINPTAGNVGIGTAAPAVGARLDITGTGATASSIIIPRDTVVNRPTVGVNGMMRYATDTNKFEAYQNGAWVDMIGSATIGGSGTTNYVPKFSAAAALGDSQIFDNGTNVGIGTNSPTAQLHILGSSASLTVESTAAVGVPGIQSKNTNGKIIQMWMGGSAWHQDRGLVYAPGLDFFADGNSGAGEIRFYTNLPGAFVDVPKVVFDPAGKVGIGTVSPSETLHLSSGGIMRIDSDGAFIDLYKKSTATQVSRISSSGNDLLIQATSGVTRFLTGGSERVRVDAAGNVGIGTTTPNTALDINGATSHRGMAAPALSVAGQGRIYFDSTSNTYKVSQNNGAYSDLATVANIGSNFVAKTGDTMTGPLLIPDGTTAAPALGFSSQSNTGLIYEGSNVISIVSAGAKVASFQNAVGYWSRFANTEVTTTSATPALAIAQGGAGTALTVTGGSGYAGTFMGGNVGIGTTGPAHPLDLQSNANSPLVARIYNSNAGANANSQLLFGNDSSGTAANIFLNSSTSAVYGGANSLNIHNGFNAPITFNAMGTEKMRIAGGGNVGIGTTNPAALLHIESNSTGDATRLQIKNTGTSGRSWQLGALSNPGGFTAGSFGIADMDASQWRMVIDPSGNVGIGTTSPGYKLHVSAGAAAGIFADSTNNYAVVGTSSSGYGVAGFSTTGWGVWCSSTSCGGMSAWQNMSDIRLKTDIKPIENSLEKILKLEGVSYHWKDNARDEREGQKIGLIAQEVEQVFPQVVRNDEKSKDHLPGGTKMVSYSELVAPLIQAFKEFYQKWFEDSQNVHREISSLREENTLLRKELCQKDPTYSFCAK